VNKEKILKFDEIFLPCFGKGVGKGVGNGGTIVE